MDDLYGLWRAKQPTPTELAESVAAIRAAERDCNGILEYILKLRWTVTI
jgi:hypothetical protein